MASIVPDISVVARWFLPDEPDREAALFLRAAIVDGRIDAIAAPHVPIELATALIRAARRDRFDAAAVPEALDVLRAFELEQVDAVGAAADAARIAMATGIHPADGLFIAIALQRGATLVTADRRLLEAARAVGCDARGLEQIGSTIGGV